MKKIISTILVMLFLASLAACSRKPIQDDTLTTEPNDEPVTQVTEPEEKKTPILAYYSNDSLNPYKATGHTNSSLSDLYCQSLFVVGYDYSVENELTEDYSISDNILNVELKNKVFFSDGTPLDANDVAYSFRLAKESSIYSQRLSNILDTTITSTSINFRMKDKDIYAASCLDFPIIKNGTGEEDIVIGSGPYVLKKSKGKYIFQKNKDFSFDEEVSVDKIELTDISNIENELYLVQVGGLTYVYDDCTRKRDTKQHINANKLDVSRNQLIYMAFNKDSKKINENIKNAINLCLDRKDLTRQSFASEAETTYTVFNPVWKEMEGIKVDVDKTDINTARSLMKKEGYTYTQGLLYNSEGNLSLTLLVSDSDKKKVNLATRIQSNLEKCGFEVKIRKENYESYKKALSRGEYDMYIGEVRLTSNMDLSCFFSPDGKASYGIDRSGISGNAYESFKSGEMELNTFINMFNKDTPFLPICYRDGVIYYSRELTFEGKIGENSLFKNIYTWEF